MRRLWIRIFIVVAAIIYSYGWFAFIFCITVKDRDFGETYEINMSFDKTMNLLSKHFVHEPWSKEVNGPNYSENFNNEELNKYNYYHAYSAYSFISLKEGKRYVRYYVYPSSDSTTTIILHEATNDMRIVKYYYEGSYYYDWSILDSSKLEWRNITSMLIRLGPIYTWTIRLFGKEIYDTF